MTTSMGNHGKGGSEDNGPGRNGSWANQQTDYRLSDCRLLGSRERLWGLTLTSGASGLLLVCVKSCSSCSLLTFAALFALWPLGRRNKQTNSEHVKSC